MKAVILAGGVGNRLGGDTKIGPKTMVQVGGHPLLWHIMTHISSYGLNEFVIASGYQGEAIKQYFADFRFAEHDVRIDMRSGLLTIHGDAEEVDWVVDVIDTGRWTQTAGRVRRLEKHLEGGPFLLTFGDAVSDIDVDSLLALHRHDGSLATVVAVHPPPRFGELVLTGEEVTSFSEKPIEAGWINGGMMVCEAELIDMIEGDDTSLAPELLEKLARLGELTAYRHEGFWQSMDSMRDRVLLEEMWTNSSAPWANERMST